VTQKGNKIDIRNLKEWDAYIVRRILQNEVYTGKLVHYIREKKEKKKQ
jgi:hypothetical protein